VLKGLSKRLAKFLLAMSREQRRRDFDADRFGGVQIDHQLVLGRLLDGQFCGINPLENLIYVGGGAAIEIKDIRGITHQSAGLHIFLKAVSRVVGTLLS
jgi:hypothetical protein